MLGRLYAPAAFSLGDDTSSGFLGAEPVYSLHEVVMGYQSSDKLLRSQSHHSIVLKLRFRYQLVSRRMAYSQVYEINGITGS